MSHACLTPGSGPSRIHAPPPHDPRALPLWLLSGAFAGLRDDLGRLTRPRICDAAYARGFEDALTDVLRLVAPHQAVGHARGLILQGED